MSKFEKIINSAWEKKEKISPNSQKSIIKAINETIDLSIDIIFSLFFISLANIAVLSTDISLTESMIILIKLALESNFTDNISISFEMCVSIICLKLSIANKRKVGLSTHFSSN